MGFEPMLEKQVAQLLKNYLIIIQLTRLLLSSTLDLMEKILSTTFMQLTPFLDQLINNIIYNNIMLLTQGHQIYLFQRHTVKAFQALSNQPPVDHILQNTGKAGCKIDGSVIPENLAMPVSYDYINQFSSGKTGFQTDSYATN